MPPLNTGSFATYNTCMLNIHSSASAVCFIVHTALSPGHSQLLHMEGQGYWHTQCMPRVELTMYSVAACPGFSVFFNTCERSVALKCTGYEAIDIRQCHVLEWFIALLVILCVHRDDLLAGWVILVSRSPVIQSLYETHSFLRDPELLQNLVDALQLTQSVAIRLEPLFIQGLWSLYYSRSLLCLYAFYHSHF